MPELNIPPVPNLLHWFLVLATVAMMLAWIWRQYLSDRWTGFSQKSKRRRLIRIAEKFNRVCDLREDIPAIVAVSMRAVVLFILFAVFTVLFTTVGIIGVIAIGEMSSLQSIVLNFLFFFMYVGLTGTLWMGTSKIVDEILPFIRFEKYQEKTHERLARLLVETDFPTGGLLRHPTDLPTDKLAKWLLFEVKKTPPVKTQQN